MVDEFALKNPDGKWIPGYVSREAAIAAGLAEGRTQLTTAKVENQCPSYFARFEAKTILARMLSGLEYGEEIGKLVGGASAIERLNSIESADIALGKPEDERKEFKLRLDLMNRLQDAVHDWIVENELQFELPKFIADMSEELHVAGPDLNIQLV